MKRPWAGPLGSGLRFFDYQLGRLDYSFGRSRQYFRLGRRGSQNRRPEPAFIYHGCLIVFAPAGKLPFRKVSMAGKKISGASIWPMWPAFSITSRRAFG